MDNAKESVKALIAYQDPAYFEKAQTLRNFVTVVGTVSTPQALREEVQDVLVDVIFFMGKGNKHWQTALKEARYTCPNRLLAIYGVGDQTSNSQKKWCEQAALDDYLVFPQERDRLKHQIESIRHIHEHYLKMLEEKSLAFTRSTVGQVYKNCLGGSHLLEAPIFKTTYVPSQIFIGSIELAIYRPDQSLLVFQGSFDDPRMATSAISIPLAELLYELAATDLSLEQIVKQMNAKLEPILPSGSSIPYGIFELASDLSLTVINGGLPPIMMVSRDSFKIDNFYPSSLPLGAVSSKNYKICTHQIQVNSGDELILCNHQLLADLGFSDHLLAYEWLEHLIKRNHMSPHLYEAVLRALCQRMELRHFEDQHSLLFLTIPSEEMIQNLWQRYQFC